MKEINPLKEAIKLYAKQLRMPTFSNYENVVRQLAPGDGYDQFLCQLMKLELTQRQEASQRTGSKGQFSCYKVLDEFEFKDWNTYQNPLYGSLHLVTS